MKRIRYFDLLRCISFCFIIFYHMISQLYFSRLFPLDKVLPFYENDNMNIAMLGVAVFFILSGAGLAYSTGENFNIRRLQSGAERRQGQCARCAGAGALCAGHLYFLFYI